MALEATIPHDAEELSALHEDVASEFWGGLLLLGDVIEHSFDAGAAQRAFRALLFDGGPGPWKLDREDLAAFEAQGWRDFLNDAMGSRIDIIEWVVGWRQAAEYAGQGICPGARLVGPSVEARREAVKALVQRAAQEIELGKIMHGERFLHLWRGVQARGALDGFGGLLTAEGLGLLSGAQPSQIRQAIAAGELTPAEDGGIPLGQARAWLARRREFRPSRWLNLDDDQWPVDRSKVLEPDAAGNVWVPQDADGVPFTPVHVVRVLNRTGGLRVTTGAKGYEVQHDSYADAFAALMAMEVPRWRRRNEAGNWGIVRARGNWVAVPLREIERQLVALGAEAGR